MNLKIFYWTSVVYRFLPFIHLSPSRHLDFYFSSLPLEEKNTNKETESISYFPLNIISIFFSSFPPLLHQESEYVSIADLPGYGMTGDIDIFDRIPICFRGILPCSRDENEKRERETLFGKRARVSTCFETLRMVARRWLRFSTERANRKVGRGEGARSALQSCAM